MPDVTTLRMNLAPDPHEARNTTESFERSEFVPTKIPIIAYTLEHSDDCHSLEFVLDSETDWVSADQQF